jgi:hypothetical protein
MRSMAGEGAIVRAAATGIVRGAPARRAQDGATATVGDPGAA